MGYSQHIFRQDAPDQNLYAWCRLLPSPLSLNMGEKSFSRKMQDVLQTLFCRHFILRGTPPPPASCAPVRRAPSFASHRQPVGVTPRYELRAAGVPPRGGPAYQVRALTACSIRSIPFSMFFMEVA